MSYSDNFFRGFFVKENDKIILDLLKKGDKAGFEMLFNLFYRPLVLYARQYIVKVEDAEDIVQEVFIRLWNFTNFADINSSIRSYIYQSVRNACINFLKSDSRKIMNPVDSIPDLTEEVMLDELEWNKYMEEIYSAVESLPPRTREIFKSIVLEKKKYKDVAQEMNISVNTVKTAFSRALSTLRANLSNGANVVLLTLL